MPTPSVKSSFLSGTTTRWKVADYQVRRRRYRHFPAARHLTDGCWKAISAKFAKKRASRFLNAAACDFSPTWVMEDNRQRALLNHFWGKLKKGASLIFYYCNRGNAVNDDVPRMIVGMSRIVEMGDQRYFGKRADKPGEFSYLVAAGHKWLSQSRRPHPVSGIPRSWKRC